MIYILVFVLRFSDPTGHAESMSAGSVEFDNAAACDKAAAEMHKQSAKWRAGSVIMCTPKSVAKLEQAK